MRLHSKHAVIAIAIALIATVVTQLAYLGLGASGQSHIAYPIWRIEAFAALAVSVLGFVLVGRNALVGGCLAAGGIFNLIQVGMGLTMFYQLGYGGETPPEPAFFAILNMSFFLYFAAKAAFGVAGIAMGLALWRAARGLRRIIGLLAAVTGAAALLINTAAMGVGMDIVFPAGAAGTAGTLFLALALLAVFRREAPEAS